MTRLVGFCLTLLIFLSGSVLEGKVRFGDFTIASESNVFRSIGAGGEALKAATNSREHAVPCQGYVKN